MLNWARRSVRQVYRQSFKVTYGKGKLVIAKTKLFLTLVFLSFGLVNCAAIKPYEKEYLLNPLMDDQTITKLEGGYTTKTRPRERLAAAGVNSGSTSCPTCGGK